MPSNKIRVAEVAKAAQVSMATVDRVLNGRGGVSDATQARVLEAARQLHADRPRQAPARRWLEVPVLMQSPSIEFYSDLRTQFQLHEPDLQAMNVRLSIHAFDTIEPEEVADTIISHARDADALVLATHDHPLVRKAVSRARQYCQVITVASDLPASGRMAYVGTDAYAAGRLAGDLMGRMLGPQGGPILLIKGYQHFTSHEHRERGIIDALRENFPRVRIIAHGDTREDPGSAGEIAGDALRVIPGLRGIYNTSVGDEGIAMAIAAGAERGQVVFIAHDLTPVNRALLEGGLVDVIIDQALPEQSGRALQAVLARYGRAAAPLSLSQQSRIVLRESLSPATTAEGFSSKM